MRPLGLVEFNLSAKGSRLRHPDWASEPKEDVWASSSRPRPYVRIANGRASFLPSRGAKGPLDGEIRR